MSCDHCGTVERALKRWLPEEIAGCECLCHPYREGRLTAEPGNWKRKKKKKEK